MIYNYDVTCDEKTPPVGWEGSVSQSVTTRAELHRTTLIDFLQIHGIRVHGNAGFNAIEWFNQTFPTVLDIDHGCWLAGGAILAMLDQRDMVGRDLDLFFQSLGQSDLIENHIRTKQSHTRHVTGNATTFKLGTGEVLQVIRRNFFDSPEQLLSTFDFSVCQWATDGKTLVYSDQALKDWKTKTLRNVLGVKETDTVVRFNKYLLNGYTPDVATSNQILQWILDDSEYFTDTGGYPS